jgi:DNA-binding GntR family transcriptional regulator
MTGTLPGHHTNRRTAPARRIRDVLRARILTGAYGEKPLPSETQLAAEFGASRNIVRDVLALLRGFARQQVCRGVVYRQALTAVLADAGEARGSAVVPV